MTARRPPPWNDDVIRLLAQIARALHRFVQRRLALHRFVQRRLALHGDDAVQDLLASEQADAGAPGRAGARLIALSAAARGRPWRAT